MKLFIGVEFTIGSVTYRYADSMVEVDGLVFEPGLMTQSLRSTMEPGELQQVEISSSVDWARIASGLHWLVDGGDARMVLIVEDQTTTAYWWTSGMVQEFQWGEVSETCTFSISTPASKSNIIPNEQAVINTSTQPPPSISGRTVSIGGAGKVYPLIIGWPGINIEGNVVGVVPVPVANIKDSGGTNQFADLIISDGVIDATQVSVYNKTMGTVSGVTNPATLSIQTRVDGLGRTYSYVPLNDGTGTFIDLFGEENDSYCVGFAVNQGGLLHEGQVCRRAGDIIHWALTTQCSQKPDYASIDNHRSWFNRYAFDTYINVPTNALEWLQEAVVKYLPAKLVNGRNGLYVAPIPTTPSPTACRYTIEQDQNASRLDFKRNGTIVNELTVSYAPNSDVTYYIAQTFRSATDQRLAGAGIGVLEDSRVSASEVCAQSGAIYGVRSGTIELPTVFRRPTAELIANDYVAINAFPQMVVQYRCDPSLWDITIGETVRIVDNAIGLNDKFGAVTDITFTPDAVEITISVYNSTQQAW